MAIIDFNSVSGVSTVTATSSIRVGSGVTITSTSIVGVSTVGVTTIFVGTGASISSPATNVLTLGTNNSESVRINSSGNFGLGTNDPQVRLDVRQDSSSTTTMAGIRVQNTNITGDSQSGISFFNYDNFGAKIYTLRTGSPQGVLVFATNNGNGIAESNVIERLRIDSSGRVTMPYQPAFMVRGDETGSKASASKFSFTSSGGNSKSNFDRLGNWSDANDRFTAPVAGIYNFYFGLYRQSATSSYFSVAPRVNGSQLVNGDIFIFFTAATGETGNTDDGMYGTFTFNLAANDYVELFMRDGANTISIYAGHTFFGGHLIG